MSTETLSRPVALPDEQEPTTLDVYESPKMSPSEAAARRVADMLHDYADRQVAKQNQAEAYESYDDNIQYTKEYDAAWDANNKFDRHEARKEKARGFLRNIGRVAVGGLRKAGRVSAEAGLVGAGVGVLGAEATVRGAKFASKTVVETARSATESTKDAVVSGANKAEAFAGKAGEKMENGINAAIEKGADVKQFFVDKMNAAKDRRQARRERWAARRQKATETARAGYERNKARVDVARGTGRSPSLPSRMQPTPPKVAITISPISVNYSKQQYH